MTHFFQFESDFVDSLRCIPMQVRFNLDTCGIKLKLHHWNQLPAEARQALVDLPCTTEAEVQAYREFLRQTVQAHSSEIPSDLAIDPHPAWLDESTVPESVQEKAKSIDFSITPQQWATLTPLQRFALLKLSRSQHENRNFLPAMKEFQLL